MTTVYIVGNGSGSFTPASTVTAKVEVWGAGAAGHTNGVGGTGGGYAAKNSQSLTAGTPVAFQLGAPGAAIDANGGDTWFSSSATVIAQGGGSATTQIGDTTFVGGVGNAGQAIGNTGAGGAG